MLPSLGALIISVNSSCAYPPPRTTAGHLHALSVPESGINLPHGYPRTFDTHVVSNSKYNWTWRMLSEKTSNAPDWLVRQGLGRIVEVFKGMFPGSILYIFSFLKSQLECTVEWSGKLKDQHEFVFRIQNVCDDFPGMGHLPCKTTTTTTKMLIPGSWIPGGEGGGVGRSSNWLLRKWP